MFLALHLCVRFGGEGGPESSLVPSGCRRSQKYPDVSHGSKGPAQIPAAVPMQHLLRPPDSVATVMGTVLSGGGQGRSSCQACGEGRG